MQFCFYSIQEITSANISISDLQFAYHFPLLISDISQELPTPSYHQLLFIFYFTPFHLLTDLLLFSHSLVFKTFQF